MYVMNFMFGRVWVRPSSLFLLTKWPTNSFEFETPALDAIIFSMLETMLQVGFEPTSAPTSKALVTGFFLSFLHRTLRYDICPLF